MSAINSCLSKGHYPNVTIGNPSGEEKEDECFDGQVVYVNHLSGNIVALDKQGVDHLHHRDWILSFTCDLCNTNEVENTGEALQKKQRGT
jgi:hypothetical protein